MAKVGAWESGFHEMFIPLECPQCGEKISVKGEIDGTQIRLDKCPNCGASFEVTVEQHTGEEEGIDEEAAKDEATRGVGFTLTIENMGLVKKASYELAGFKSVIDGLVGLIDVACLICISPEFPPQKLKDLIIRTMLPKVYSLEGLEELVVHINEIIEQNKARRGQGD